MGLAGAEDRTSGPWWAPRTAVSFTRRPMMDDLPLLRDRIKMLLDRQRDGSSALHADVLEHTLTDGYAGALALEAERDRVRRRMHSVAEEAESADHARELQALVIQLDRTEAEIAELRDLLRSLAATR
jgi:hypothetical protein